MTVFQSCPTLCDPMNDTFLGILQARILEWAAFHFSRGSSQPRDQTQVSLITGGFFTSWAKGKPKGKKLGIFPPKSLKALGWPIGKRRNILAINDKKVKIQRSKPMWWWCLPGSVWPYAKEDRQMHEACKKLRWWTGKHPSVQFSSVAQSCPTLCNPMNRSTPGLPVHHHLPEFT